MAPKAALSAFVLLAAIAGSSGAAIAQFENDPFYEFTEPVRFAFAAEMIEGRAAAVAAVAEEEDDAGELLPHLAAALEEDLPLLIGSLRAKDPELAGSLEAALLEAFELAEKGDDEALPAAAEEVGELARRAQSALVPAVLRQSPPFVAAVITELLLSEDGIAEAFEESFEAEGEDEGADVEEEAEEGEADEEAVPFPVGWALLQQVKELWSRIRPAGPADLAAEIDEFLGELDALFPSPEAPESAAVDPEEGEKASHMIVAGLERLTASRLYPDRDLGAILRLVRRQVASAYGSFLGGEAEIGAERLAGAAFYYEHYLADPFGLFFPEEAEEVEELFEGDELDARRFEALLAILREAGAMFGG